MLLRSLALIAMIALAATAQAGQLSRTKLVAAAVESANDNISSGWCGRGIYSILNKSGLGNGLKQGNGQDWEKILADAGWKPVACASPFKAPLGSVLVYLGDARMGKRNRGTPGGSYGHVEMVALAPSGQRLYVSDCPRPLPGGSVFDNFTRRAWMPPGGSILAPLPPVDQQVAAVLEERKRMALAFFDKRQQLTENKTATSSVQVQ